MAETVINTAHFRQIWAQGVFVEAKEKMFFKQAGLMGAGENAVVQELTDLSAARGNRGWWYSLSGGEIRCSKNLFLRARRTCQKKCQSAHRFWIG